MPRLSLLVLGLIAFCFLSVAPKEKNGFFFGKAPSDRGLISLYRNTWRPKLDEKKKVDVQYRDQKPKETRGQDTL